MGINSNLINLRYPPFACQEASQPNEEKRDSNLPSVDSTDTSQTKTSPSIENNNSLPPIILKNIFKYLLVVGPHWNAPALVCKKWRVIFDDTHPLKELKKIKQSLT